MQRQLCRPFSRALLLGTCLASLLGSTACEAPDDTLDEPRSSERGTRICELFELAIVDGKLGARVWNNGGFHDCPDDYLAAVDRDRYGVGGPRWRSVDEIVTIDANGEPLEVEPAVAEIPAGLGHDMFLAAEVGLVPISALEQQLGISIESVEDIPEALGDEILATTVAGNGYVPVEVHRTYGTTMTHYAGQEVYVLDDGSCRYAMKFYTSVVEPSLVDEEAVAELGDRLELPEGYSFSVETFDEDLVITVPSGVTQVIADELGNSYDVFECD